MNFYLHDRLGSTRQVINKAGSVVRYYTFDPFGKKLEYGPPPSAAAYPFMFTGQYFDWEIGQYYLRARQYDPLLMRMTTIDPDRGEPLETLTLHKYLYCVNNPINKTDPSGEIYLNVANALQAAATVYSAGLLIACYGAEHDNLELLVAGGFVMQLTPLAYFLGLGFGDKMITVTRWGDAGERAGWAMAGKKNYLNYLLSGKWLGTNSNQFAAYGTGHSWKVMASQLKFPSGWKWVFGFFGQVMTP